MMTHNLSDETKDRISSPEQLRHTDVANAERLRKYFGSRLRHKTGLGWLAWDDKRWHMCEKEVRRHAQELGRHIRAEAESSPTNSEMIAKTIQHSNRAESTSGINFALREAQVLDGIDANSLDFDAHRHLLNVENGTLDLRTGKLLPHNPNDHLTKLAPIRYDPTAKATRWKQFLLEVFCNDHALVDYMQWVVGYSLTGFTMHDVFFVLYGEGRNGKSTLLLQLTNILGKDYAQELSPELLLQQKYAQHPTSQAALRGIRFAKAVETNEGRQLNEALIKALTGGDPIRARFMHKDEFQFRPELKLFLATNHKPLIRDSSKGMWSRVRLIPFEATFDKGNPLYDPDLRDVTLPAEREGILAWAVEGAKRVEQGEPPIPPRVKAATDAYQNEQDLLGRFLAEECDTGGAATISKQDLHAAYQEYCGGRCESSQQFSSRLKALGYEDGRTHGGTRLWKGISLKGKDTQESSGG